MKKFLLCILSMILIIAIVPSGIVSAESSPVITVGNANAKRGETVNIHISIADNPGILAMAFSITYDATALEYVGYEKGYLSNYNIMDHADKGFVSFVSVEDQELNTNGSILALTFRVKENVPNGTYEIGIANNNPEKYGESLHNSFANSNEQFIIPTIVKGYVNIADIMKGDANGDGAVNTRDAAIVMQYANGWNVTINLDSADVNGDGLVNTRDYALLIQYANGWNVEFK